MRWTFRSTALGRINPTGAIQDAAPISRTLTRRDEFNQSNSPTTSQVEMFCPFFQNHVSATRVLAETIIVGLTRNHHQTVSACL